jgi:Protein of unknown function (DUF3108)
MALIGHNQQVKKMPRKIVILISLFIFFAGTSALAGTTDINVDTPGQIQSAEKNDSGDKKVSTKNIPFGKIVPEIAKIAYSGGEKMIYDISWTGGIKIGELRLEIKKVPKEKETYEILAKVTTDNGMLQYIYPVKDTHITIVKGDERLPVYYEIWQKEGRSYTAHRVTKYEQNEGKVIYKKDGDPKEEFKINGTTYNEFSSFFGSRVMPLEVNKPFKVPTFADDKRNEVVVEPMRKTHLDDTVIGPVDTVEVMPILTFKGLYDKQGDTVIWYTDDACRVPVLINSRIVIGSLTSTLVYYSNPACEKYSMYQAKNADSRVNQ